MKLTTSSDFSKKKPMSKVAALKGLIQQAASSSNKQSIATNVVIKSSQSHSHLNNNFSNLSTTLNFQVFNIDNAPKKKLTSSKIFENSQRQNKQNFYQQNHTQKTHKNNHPIKLSKSSSNLLQNFKNLKFGKVKQMKTQRDMANTQDKVNQFFGNHKSSKFQHQQQNEKKGKNLMVSSLQFKRNLLSSSSLKQISIKQLSKRRFNYKRQSEYILSIERFQLGKKIGKGRFGSVYIAQDKQTKFVLAIKTINKKQLKEANMQEQLLSEIKLQMYMRHPNVLKMYGFFSDQNSIYLLLQLAQDCIFRIMNNRDGFNQSQASYYIKQVLQSMKYMHSESIIHRDIKPQNILVAYGVAKIGDFGWSVYSPLYKRQTFCGTLDYVSPQIVQGQFYDEKSDIWSLGVLIYQFVTGQAPFQSDKDQDDTFNKIVSGQVQMPKKVSKQVQSLIRSILIKNPKKRLTLKEIDNSQWLKKYQKQGRYISPQIWNFWLGK